MSIDNLDKVQTITFDYTINVEPPSLVQWINSTGSVTLDVKQFIIKKTASQCIRHFPPDVYRSVESALAQPTSAVCLDLSVRFAASPSVLLPFCLCPFQSSIYCVLGNERGCRFRCVSDVWMAFQTTT